MRSQNYSSNEALSTAITDGLEEAIRRQPTAETLRIWRDLVDGRLSFEEYYGRMSSEDELTCLTVDTTGACDLTCRGMCYYHPDIPLQEKEVPFAPLALAVEEAGRLLGLKTLVLAGKEPFLNPRRLFALIESAGRLPGRDFEVGAVTNGRHVERHWDKLVEVANKGCLDFIDISIDSGFPEQHDSIRGIPGTHDLAVTALRRIIEHLPEVRASVCSILRADNPGGILELIRRQSDVVRRFWIFPIQPPPFSPLLPLNPAFITGFFQDVLTLLSGKLRDTSLQITAPLQGIYLSEAVGAGLFGWQDLREHAPGACHAIVRAGSSTVLFQCCVLPEQAWKLARITYTGDYLAHLHFLQTPDPHRMAVGNIRNEAIRDLYRKSKAPGSVFHRLCEVRASHECRSWMCWQHCFGGWSVAEQSLLDGTPLNRKPRLCTKRETDLIPISGAKLL
jgi:MoaA/NifB/PqqE/SkfB family radical SAM enzyme